MTTGRVRELIGWLSAALIAVVTTGQIASSARSDLLFRDGDSLVVALLVRSITEGQPFDWAMSSVLFLPETALFAVLWLGGRMLALDVGAVLALNAVVNLVALYGAIRLVAGRRRTGHAPVAWSLGALAVFCAIATTEASPSRDALEPASLLLTTTYYSATAIAVVLSVGLVRRAFDSPGRIGGSAVTLGLVAAASTLSNPLYAAWGTVPLVVLLGLCAVYPATRGRGLLLLWWLIGGTIVGLIARIPFGAWIANTGAGYAQPALWPESARYYGELLTDRLSTPLGMIGTLLLVTVVVLAVRQTFRATEPGARLVAAAAWVLPLLVVLGAIALGTNAARYLEPIAFAPVLGLVAIPRTLRMPRRVALAVSATAAVLFLIGAGLSAPRIVTAAQRPDADLACVTDWVNASGQTGAGQFWTVRLPKLHLDDPSQLVQVDHQLRGYAWLVNRTDFAVGKVSFLVEDAQSIEWELGQSAIPTDVVSCGRYTIIDFAPATLPLGPERS